jgi:hypothetical protein
MGRADMLGVAAQGVVVAARYADDEPGVDGDAARVSFRDQVGQRVERCRRGQLGQGSARLDALIVPGVAMAAHLHEQCVDVGGGGVGDQLIDLGRRVKPRVGRVDPHAAQRARPSILGGGRRRRQELERQQGQQEPAIP